MVWGLTVLERHVTLAEEEEQQGELQSMWEMADVLDFLRVFSRDIPGLATLEWTASGLESALITSTGGPGLLASIHMVSAWCSHSRGSFGPTLPMRVVTSGDT